MTRLRTIAAWVFAVVAFCGIRYVAETFGAAVGVPLNVDDHTTVYGWGATVLSILAGIEAWYLVSAKELKREGRAYFLTFLAGSVVLIVGGVSLWKAFEHSSGWAADAGKMLELALFGAAFFIGKKVWDHLRADSQRAH